MIIVDENKEVKNEINNHFITDLSDGYFIMW